ncbi:metal-dependent hydrolase [Desulfogranum japonicum]|uniref:metal-dependent hydrolase n=1 Tax=Desulfogranum japonicum TaxID=231447 RepID=UPI00048C4FDD|nr:metal-dependent hydrolase [Desulfogranum japonicum]
MPSPVGHTLSVCIALPILGRGIWQKKASPSLLLASIFVANSPDIDFLAGFLVGAPNQFHHQLTHSFFFALITGILFAVLFSDKDKQQKNSTPQRTRLFLYFTFLATLHLVLDLFCTDTTAPFGLMLLWPLSNEYLISPIALFSDIRRASDTSSFIPSLFSLHNFLAVLQEVGILTGLCLMSWWGETRVRMYSSRP